MKKWAALSLSVLLLACVVWIAKVHARWVQEAPAVPHPTTTRARGEVSVPAAGRGCQS